MKPVISKLIFAIISLLLSILIGIFLPAIVEHFSNGTIKIILGEQIIITITFFLTITFLEFLYLYYSDTLRQKEEFAFWSIKFEGDHDLHNIRNYFHKVVHDSKTTNDIFVQHFLNEFKKLLNKISNVAEKKEIFFNADYFLNADNILKVFPSFEDSVWRYVWKINTLDEPLFQEPAWQQFFAKTAKMVQKKEMKQIQAIIVLDKPEFKEADRIKKLFHFFKTNERIDCRLISTENYVNICKLNSFENSIFDFGIYGTNLLFVESYFNTEVRGTFSKDPHKINQYLKLFDCFWDAETITDENPSNETSILNVIELIRFDLNYKHESK